MTSIKHKGVVLLEKARLAPMKDVSISRMELSAAVVAVRLYQMLKSEIDLQIDKNCF